MSEREAMILLWPALGYPNCIVRQARLTQLLQALLCKADTADRVVINEILSGWAEQDALRLYQVGTQQYDPSRY